MTQLPDGRPLEEAGQEEWRQHAQPLLHARAIEGAAAAAKGAQVALDEAVANARRARDPGTHLGADRSSGRYHPARCARPLEPSGAVTIVKRDVETALLGAR